MVTVMRTPAGASDFFFYRVRQSYTFLRSETHHISSGNLSFRCETIRFMITSVLLKMLLNLWSCLAPVLHAPMETRRGRVLYDNVAL